MGGGWRLSLTTTSFPSRRATMMSMVGSAVEMAVAVLVAVITTKMAMKWLRMWTMKSRPNPSQQQRLVLTMSSVLSSMSRNLVLVVVWTISRRREHSHHRRTLHQWAVTQRMLRRVVPSAKILLVWMRWSGRFQVMKVPTTTAKKRTRKRAGMMMWMMTCSYQWTRRRNIDVPRPRHRPGRHGPARALPLSLPSSRRAALAAAEQ
mmetsp:Transcript_20659/g.46072  ORF Transcript_20659/g.46072 Transcript_20659/m.46072 type:complete len:205 (-) Transcript_20659:2234-2848(-)